ncbi:MAG: hypothetical protein WAT93_11185 [Pontixanthobacter sp.]
MKNYLLCAVALAAVGTIPLEAAQAQLKPSTTVKTPLSRPAPVRPIEMPSLKPPAPPAPPVKPTRNALVIILENGGIVKNLDPALQARLNTTVTFAKCGNFDFPMKQGEDIGRMLNRLAGQISTNADCINPFAWRFTTMKLSDWVDEQTDKMLEDTIKGGNSIIATQRRYDHVAILEDRDATPSVVLARMKQLAPNYVLDVHVLTHGDVEQFIGYRGASFDDNNFFGILRNEQRANKPMFIRAVYQMNCSSGTLKDNWESVGAEAVNGTNGAALNSMPWQYFHFMGNWINDRDSFATSTMTATDEAAFYTTPIYTVLGMLPKVNESRLTLSPGSNGGLKVD